MIDETKTDAPQAFTTLTNHSYEHLSSFLAQPNWTKKAALQLAAGFLRARIETVVTDGRPVFDGNQQSSAEVNAFQISVRAWERAVPEAAFEIGPREWQACTEATKYASENGALVIDNGSALLLKALNLGE
jgi:hypothetical protein